LDLHIKKRDVEVAIGWIQNGGSDGEDKKSRKLENRRIEWKEHKMI